MRRTPPDLMPSRLRLAENLRELRQRSGFSQERLAELAGFHRTYVSQVERAVRNVSLDNLDKLARALEVDVTEMLAPAKVALEKRDT